MLPARKEHSDARIGSPAACPGIKSKLLQSQKDVPA